MKKSLLLLALSLQVNAEPSYSNIPREVHLANIETNIETPVGIIYRHPRAKMIGEHMPQPLGKKVSHTNMLSINTITRESKAYGLIIGYGSDRDKIPEYQSIIRFCDGGSDVETYAVFDINHKLLYIDSSRDGRIDRIIGDMDTLESVLLYIVPIECEQEKPLESFLEN